MQENKDITEKNLPVGGTLYLVATPIGNLEDISARAQKILSGVDFVAAEDTRNSAKLLNLYGIKKPLVSYFEHNKKARGEEICARIENGESCALITDAGTPAISDPGQDIVCLCAARGIPVYSVPGACAAVTALSVSALPTERFLFEGFLPRGEKERGERLSEIKLLPHTLIFYEAPHRLCRTLRDLLAALGDRRAAVCREITKLNEQTLRAPLSEIIEHFDKNEPRGEFVILLSGASGADAAAAAFWADMEIEEHLRYYIDGGMRKNDAVKAVARDRKVAKNEIYRIACEME